MIDIRRIACFPMLVLRLLGEAVLALDLNKEATP